MPKTILLFFILILIGNLNSQVLPESYFLEDENKLGKTAASNPASSSITDIVTIGDTVWLGTGMGLSLSTDRGANWTNFFNHPAFDSKDISAIGYDPYTGTFWAAKAYITKGPGDADVQTGAGYAFTNDAGRTWTTIPQAVDRPDDSLLTYGINDGINLPQVRILPVTVPQQNLTFDFAFTPGTIWITSWAGGLRKSTDKGLSWQRVILPTDSLDSISPLDTLKGDNGCISPVDGNFCSQGWLNYSAFSVISINDSTLFVGTADGINKSTDGGISWRKFNHLNQENSISGNFVVALGYNSADNVLWSATWKANGETEYYAVSASTDGGENWQVYLKDERVHNFGFKGNSTIAASDNGALRTFNKGISWILPSSIVDDETNLSVRTNIFYSAASEGNDIWLGSSDGLAKLIDETAPWTGTWKVYFASQTEIVQDEAFVYPNPFSPRIDAGGLKFKYNTNGKIENVTIRIFNFGMHFVRTIIQNAPRNLDGVTNPDPQVWDGKDDSGNTVPNGVYFYRIEIGDNDPKFGKILVLQ